MIKPLDLAVIGGGPVGLYTAIKLAMKGHRVSLFDKRSWPIDKVCGQGIMPSGVERLKKIGIKFNYSNSSFINGVEYIDRHMKVGGVFPEKGLGVERIELSKLLLEKAKTFENIRLYPNTSIDSITNKDIGVEIGHAESAHTFDYVFGCDGLLSFVREQLDKTKVRKKNLRMGARVHCQIAPWSENVQVYWGNGIEAYVTPVREDRIEIAFLWFKSHFQTGPNLEHKLFDEFPALKEKLSGVQCESDFKGCGPFSKYSKCIQDKRVVFVGDSYLFKDGITGEGVSLGFKAADIVSETFNKPSYFSRLHIKLLYLNYLLWVELALFMSRNTKMRRATLRFLDKHQRLFNLILNLNDLSFTFMKKLY